MAKVSVRYIVHDVDAAIEFYQLEVSGLDDLVATLRAANVPMRSDVVDGVGGRQVIVDDPSGNPVELFEPTRAGASLG